MLSDKPWPKGTLIQRTFHSNEITLWDPEEYSFKTHLEKNIPVMWLGYAENVISPDFMNYNDTTAVFLLHEKRVWVTFLPQDKDEKIIEKYFEKIE